jgi:hypothetical protein
LQHLPIDIDQTSADDRSDQSLENPVVDQRTPAQEGPRRGKCTLGCSRAGKPPRMSSNSMEMREKHLGGLEK